MKILLVEDEKNLSNAIRESLEDEYDIEQAFDGEEACLYAKQDIYDVIILDLMLPRKDGYEVLDEIRSTGIFVPVLILTAKDSLDDKLKGFQKGADDYLTKTFAKEELKARIEVMIRRNNPNYYQKELNFKALKLNVNIRKAYIEDNQLNLQGKQLNKEQFNLDDEIKSIILLYKETAKSQQKDFCIDLKYNGTITADLNKIKQLLVILLDNALKYTEKMIALQ